MITRATGAAAAGGPPPPPAAAERARTVSARPLDAASLEVLWTRLISIADEAAAALVRTSFSTDRPRVA